MPVAYHRPSDLGTALALAGSGDVSVIAGGTDWFPARGHRPPDRDILDLTGIEALRGIVPGEGGSLRIGATATWTDVARAPLSPAFDALRAAARVVGGVQIQNAGTVAGNLCNASPAADGVPPLLTLDAEVEIASASGTRRMDLADFLQGPRRTALAPGEVLVAIHIPAPPDGARAAFEKLGARTYLVISIAMVAVLVVPGADGRIAQARVAVGACAPTARRLPALEAALIGQDPATPAIDPAHLAPLAPIGDVRADAAYRTEAVPHLIARAIAEAMP